MCLFLDFVPQSPDFVVRKDRGEHIVFSSVEESDFNLNWLSTLQIGGILLQEATFSKSKWEVIHVPAMHSVFLSRFPHSLLLLEAFLKAWGVVFVPFFSEEFFIFHPSHHKLINIQVNHLHDI